MTINKMTDTITLPRAEAKELLRALRVFDAGAMIKAEEMLIAALAQQAANPTAIINLLDEMGKLHAQVTELTLDRDEFQQMHHRCIDDIKSILTERDTLRQQLSEAQALIDASRKQKPIATVTDWWR